MGQIYSYLNAEKLFKPRFRRELFDYLYDQELLDLGELVGLEEFRREEIISALMRIPWGANEESKAISEFLGIQSWILELHDETIFFSVGVCSMVV